MQLRLRSEQIAGLLSLLAAALAGVAWYIYLFVATPANRPLSDSVYRQLAHSFSPENAERWWFIWFAALPLSLCIVGVAYLAHVARSRTLAMLLVTVLVILAGSSFYLTNWSLAVFVSLPIFWGWRCVHGA